MADNTRTLLIIGLVGRAIEINNIAPKYKKNTGNPLDVFEMFSGINNALVIDITKGDTRVTKALNCSSEENEFLDEYNDICDWLEKLKKEVDDEAGDVDAKGSAS